MEPKIEIVVTKDKNGTWTGCVVDRCDLLSRDNPTGEAAVLDLLAAMQEVGWEQLWAEQLAEEAAMSDDIEPVWAEEVSQDDWDINTCRTCGRQDCVSFRGADCPRMEELHRDMHRYPEKYGITADDLLPRAGDNR